MDAANLSAGETMTINIIDTIIIPAGQSLSNAVDCKTWTIVRITVPAEWSYAPLSFLVSSDNILPYANVCLANGKERILEVQPNSAVLGTGILIPAGWIKFRSGTSSLAVPQKNTVQFRIALEV
jgi:hypothetical protein